MREFEMLGTGTVTAEVTVFTDEAGRRVHGVRGPG